MTKPAITFGAARKHVAQIAFGDVRNGKPEDEVPGGIGLEPEYFVVRSAKLGERAGRPALYGNQSEPGILDWLGSASQKMDAFSAAYAGSQVPRFELACGGQLTFEPGGQVEHSTRVHPNAAVAMEDLVRVRSLLSSVFEEQDCSLLALGVDPWHDVDEVPQQLPGGRYRAQAEFYETAGRFGRVMMRHSTSLQINLDFGESASVALERWNIANLVSPLITCTFSTSPGKIRGERGHYASRRAHVWRKLDPTRTGFSRAFLESENTDAGLAYADQVLDANVMLFRRDGEPEGMATGGQNFSFRDWIDQGHPDFGVATLEDLDYHLTTVFPEVRARGFMELRAADGLPLDLVGPFVVFLTGLVYDPVARKDALAILAPHRPRLDEYWGRAAKDGLADAELCILCRWIWPLALEGAKRLPKGFFRDEDLAAAEAFLERFVFDCRSTSDELAVLLESTPGEALNWHK